MKLLLNLLFIASLVSCVGTVEQATVPPTSDESKVQDFAFTGIEKSGWISNRRLYAKFKQASGEGPFEYRLVDSTGQILAAALESDLEKDMDGFFTLVATELAPGAKYTIGVKAYERSSETIDSNTKTQDVDMPNQTAYSRFDGITTCENFPGAAGRNQMIVKWDLGYIEAQGGALSGNTPDSVDYYTIYVCEQAEGSNCIIDGNTTITPRIINDPLKVEEVVTSLDEGVVYNFRITATSKGDIGNGVVPVEERNIYYSTCRTQSSADEPIVFAGIQEFELDLGESGVSNGTVRWDSATGGFSGYMIFYHPVADETSPFNYSDPNITSTAPGAISLLDTEYAIGGLEPFAYNAVLVKACFDLVNDPGCINGSDGGGTYIIQETRPPIAAFGGITSTPNDPANPTRVFLNFDPANTSLGGIYDEYRIFVLQGGNSYDISATNASNTLGSIYPGAPSQLHSLFLDGFIPTDKTATQAILGGMQSGILYQVDMLPYVDRIVNTNSGGTKPVEYTDTSFSRPVNVSNTDITGPQITAIRVTPATGILTTSEILRFEFDFDENVIVTGNPQVPLQIGAATIPAQYQTGGSGTQTLAFEYQVSPGDNDLDGIGFVAASIQLAGSTMQDIAGNPANVNFAAIAPNIATINVDTIPPDPVTNVTLDAQWVTSNVSPLISWTNPAQDFSYAEVAIGTTPGVANVASYVASNNSSSHNFTGLSLVQCSFDYYAVVRSVDGVGLTSTAATSATSFKYDGTLPNAPASINIVADSVEVTKSPQISWSAGSDNCQIDHYELAIGYDDESNGFDTADINNTMDWTEIPGGAGINAYEVENAVDGFSLSVTPGVFYKISIRTVDVAGNVSLAQSSADWQVDLVGPNPATGLTLASEWVSGPEPVTAPLFSWVNPTADFVRSDVILGSSSGGSEIVGLTNVGVSTQYTFTGLTGLTECQFMFPAVIGYDSSSNASPTSTHPTGFRWDNTAPTMSGSLNVSTDVEYPDNAPTVLWSGASDNCLIDHYEIAIGLEPGGTQILDWSAIPNTTSYKPVNGVDGLSFQLKFHWDHYISVRAVDGAGLVSNVLQSTAFHDQTYPVNALSKASIWQDGAEDSSKRIDFACLNEATVEGEEMRCWENKALNVGHLKYEFTTGRPKNRLANQGVYFDSDDVLESYVVDLTNPASTVKDDSSPLAGKAIDDLYVFAVQRNEPTTWQNVFDWNLHGGSTSCSPGGRVMGFAPFSDGIAYFYAYGCTGNNAINTPSAIPVNPNQETYMYAMATSITDNGKRVRINGDQLATDSLPSGQINISGPNAFTDFRPRYKQVNEFIVVDQHLTTAEIEEIEGYLACKWGLQASLPGGHPYQSACP